MGALPFVLLIAALIVFVVSTRQWALWLRGAVWAAGVLLLILAAFLVVTDPDHGGGLLRAFGDFFKDPGDSVLAQSFSRNGPHVGRFIFPLLDLFLVLAALMAVLALAAFTPGEEIERVTRPLLIGLVGAIVGGVIAMAIVGTGFGDVAQQRVYANYLKAADVVDGDTLWIGEVQVRLEGIDAPQDDQICRRRNEVSDCGAAAVRHLQDLVADALVTCTVVEGDTRRSNDAYGRPLVRCDATPEGGQPFDVGQSMVLDGYAIEYMGEVGDYAREARIALVEQSGIMNTCSLRPDVWDDDDAARAAFRDRGRQPSNRRLMMGNLTNCPRPQRPNEPGALPE